MSNMTVSNSADPAAQAHRMQPLDRVSLASALAAPWRLLQPTRAARTFAACSLPQFLFSFALAILSLAIPVVALFAVNSMHTTSWDPMTGNIRVEARTLGDVWADWRQWGLSSPVVTIPATMLILTPLAAAIGAALFVCNVHRVGSPWTSVARTYRGVAAGVGLLGCIGVGLAALMTLIQYHWSNHWPLAERLHMVWVFGLFTCIALLLRWLEWSTTALTDAADPAQPPLCEGCGYDLSHRSEGGVCTECGLPIHMSLDPAGHRQGAAWQRSRTPKDWWHSTLAALLKPRQFYLTLLTRRASAESAGFARWHYPLIGLLGAAWFASLAILEGPGFNQNVEIMLFACILTMVFPVVGWCLHRVVGSFVFDYAALQGTPADAGRLRRAMDYETAYLWAFCIFNGAMLTSFILFEDWVSYLVTGRGLYWVAGIPLEVFLVAMGNLALIIGWVLRYRIIIQCTRFANF